MNRTVRLLRCVTLAPALLALVLVPLLARGDSAEDAREEKNRARLKKIREDREDPEHYARLLQDWANFKRMTPERQERIRKLDQALLKARSESPALAARMERALERYADWLERLQPDKREDIEHLDNPKARLERIRVLRDQEWLERQPKAVQDKVKSTPGLRKELRDDDIEERQDWYIAQRNWDLAVNGKDLPVNLAMLPQNVQSYYKKKLEPILTTEEQNRLKAAEGKWPTYLRVLVKISDSHPQSVLPIFSQISDLPVEIQKDVNDNKPMKKDLEKAEGAGKTKDWKAFCNKLRDYANAERKHGGHKGKSAKFREEFKKLEFPAKLSEFSNIAVQKYIENWLLPCLDDQEKRDLNNVQNKWPAYPQEIIKLANNHNLVIPSPAINLPTPQNQPDFWERYRLRPAKLPPEIQAHRSKDPLEAVP